MRSSPYSLIIICRGSFNICYILLYTVTSSVNIRVRYIEKSGGFDKHCLYEFISSALKNFELSNLKKCSLNLPVMLMHGFNSIRWSDLLLLLPEILLIDFKCDLGFPWVSFTWTLKYLFFAPLNKVVSWFVYFL